MKLNFRNCRIKCNYLFKVREGFVFIVGGSVFISLFFCFELFLFRSYIVMVGYEEEVGI